MISDFSALKNRDAWAAIRGFYYQVQTTVVRWLALDDSCTLICECGEDIDHVATAFVDANANESRLLEQVKVREDSITLASNESVEAVANFISHQENNPNISLRFQFTTTASAGKEESAEFPDGLPGITAWGQLQADAWDQANKDKAIAAIRTVISKHAKSQMPDEGQKRQRLEHLLAIIDSWDDAHLLEAVIRPFVWAVRQPDCSDTDVSIQELLIELGIAGSTAEAGRIADSLLIHVLRLLSRRGTKSLTKQDLLSLVSSPAMSDSEKEMLSAVQYYSRRAEEELAKIAQDLATVKDNTALLPKMAEESADTNARLARVEAMLLEPGKLSHKPSMDPRLPSLTLDRFEYGIKLRESWDYDGAIQKLKGIVDDCGEVLTPPQMAKVHCALGACYRDLANYDAAAKEFEQASQLDKASYDTRRNLVICALDIDNIALARKLANDLLADFPSDSDAHATLGIVLFEEGNESDALAVFNTALGMNPDAADVYANRGLIHVRDGQLRAAFDDFSQACTLDKKHWFAQGLRLEMSAHLYQLGIGQLEPDDIVREADMFLNVILPANNAPECLKPALTEFLVARGLARLAQEDPVAAEADFNAALSHSDDPAVFQNLGMSYLMQGRRQDAHEQFRISINKGSREPLIFHNAVAFIVSEAYNTRDLGLIDEAKTIVGQAKQTCPPSSFTDTAEASVICIESHLTGLDKGLDHTIELFESVMKDNTCPESLATAAFQNIVTAQELRVAIANYRPRN